MKLLIVAIGVVILLFLISKCKLNTFISLIITSLITGLLLGVPLDKLAGLIEKGIGSQVGHLALVFGFGAMLGRIVADAGGAYRIAHTLIDKFGRRHIQIAVMMASFIIGIALFFEVGLVLLLPIIFAIASELGISLLYLGIPMVAALSITHGFLPPHPAPVAISEIYHANIGMVLLYGIIVAIPTVLIAGPLFTKVIQRFVPSAFNKKGDLAVIGESKKFQLNETPSFANSLVTSLFPVILMVIATLYELIVHGGKQTGQSNLLDKIIAFIGTPSIAMLISLILAIYTMGIRRRKSMKELMISSEEAIKGIAMMLLIIGGGGAFKEILIAGGVGHYVTQLFAHSTLSPLILAWLIAVVLRLALGSATVAALTASSLVVPLVATTGVNPVLMVIATGAGSLFFSHVNDAGFWMFKEYFNLSVKETLMTWSVLEAVISICGLIGVLILNIFV